MIQITDIQKDYYTVRCTKEKHLASVCIWDKAKSAKVAVMLSLIFNHIHVLNYDSYVKLHDLVNFYDTNIRR